VIAISNTRPDRAICSINAGLSANSNGIIATPDRALP
jgi:hypothetical protein